MKNKNLKHFLSIHRHSYKHAMHLFDIAGKGKYQRRKSKVFLEKPSFWRESEDQLLQESISSSENLRFRSGASAESLVSSTISFGSINPESRIFLRFRLGTSTRSLVSFYDSVRESRIFLRFRSGASTRSLVSSYDSVREHQPGVSYVSFKSVNPESRIFLTIPFEKCDNL